MPASEIEARAINAALEAAEGIARSFELAELEGAAPIGPWPHQAALYALTLEQIGRGAAANLIQLYEAPTEWYAADRAAADLDPAEWIVVCDAPEWPRVVHRVPTARWGWPWLSPEGLREAATCLELMLRAGVLEARGEYVGGRGLWLGEQIWNSLRVVVEHVQRSESVGPAREDETGDQS